MEQINIYEAKTKLSALVDRASAGEAVIIARHGKPMAVLIPYSADWPQPKQRPASGKLPVYPGTVTGSLRRSDIYDDI